MKPNFGAILGPVVVAALVLTGCAGPGLAVTTAGPTPLAPPAAVGAPAPPAPTAVTIPALDVSSSLVGLGLNPDGTLAVPPVDQPGQASWFDEGVTPGNDGPAVVTGHVNGRIDGKSVPGVFTRLAELRPGDEVLIDTAAGVQRWAVQRVETYPKATFPTEAVYGDTPGPALRLITCDGELGTLPDGGRSYTDNVIVYAEPA